MKLRLLEFNEIDPDLVRQGIARGDLPHFERFLAAAHCHTTLASERDDMLEPWIQWTSAHCGASVEAHGATQLGRAPQAPLEPVWETLADRGLGVWVCGAMNGRETPALADRIVLDYWTLPAEGSSFHAFSRFVNRCVAARDRRPSLGAAASFAGFMLGNGLRATTAGRSLRHVTKTVADRTGWRLSFVLEELQTDLFLDRCRRLSPDFSLLFLNSVAHLQHHYWEDMAPFRADPGRSVSRHRDAIHAGYRHLDRILGRVMQASDDSTTIAICSALGQRPCDPQGADGGDLLYRVAEPERVCERLGLPAADRVLRTMAATFTLSYEDPATATLAAERLGSIRVGELDAFLMRRVGASLDIDVAVREALSGDEPVAVAGVPTGMTAGDLFELASRRSTVHTPHGVLWVRGELPLGTTAGQPLPLEHLAPTILDCFAGAAAVTMRAS